MSLMREIGPFLKSHRRTWRLLVLLAGLLAAGLWFFGEDSTTAAVTYVLS